MIEPASINVEQLDSVLLSDFKQLPESPGVYFAIDARSNIQYIGRSSNIRQRWTGHHRKPELKKLANIRIAYLLLENEALLADIEEALISYFEPPLNGEIPNDPELKFRCKIDL